MSSVTIPASTAPGAQVYLLEAIQAEAAFDPVDAAMLVRLGQPGRNLPNDCIVITGVRSRTVNWQNFVGSAGQWALDEKYDIQIECSTWSLSGDSDDTSVVSTVSLNRAWQLVGYVETAVREDPSLGGLVNIAYPRSAVQEGPMWTSGTAGSGLLTLVTLTIHVENLG